MFYQDNNDTRQAAEDSLLIIESRFEDDFERHSKDPRANLASLAHVMPFRGIYIRVTYDLQANTMKYQVREAQHLGYAPGQQLDRDSLLGLMESLL